MKPMIENTPCLRLDLELARPIPGAVRRVAQLAHDPLEAHGAGVLEDERRLGLEVLDEVGWHIRDGDSAVDNGLS